MRNDKTPGAIADQPTITKAQARIFFNMGRDRFNDRWEKYYRHRIASVETEGGLRLLLTDVIRAAFPGASKQTVIHIAHQHLLHLKDKCLMERVKASMTANAQKDGEQEK